MIVTLYFAAAVAFAYWIGRDRAMYGIAAFIISVAAWQLVVDGPASFLEGGCTDYGTRAQAADYC